MKQMIRFFVSMLVVSFHYSFLLMVQYSILSCSVLECTMNIKYCIVYQPLFQDIRNKYDVCEQITLRQQILWTVLSSQLAFFTFLFIFYMLFVSYICDFCAVLLHLVHYKVCISCHQPKMINHSIFNEARDNGVALASTVPYVNHLHFTTVKYDIRA